MNFLGLLWVVSAIGSFWSPQDAPRFLDYFSNLRGRTAFLANQVIARPRQGADFLTSTTAAQRATRPLNTRNTRSSKSPSAAASRLWSPALAAFIDPKAASSQIMTQDMMAANLAVQPVGSLSLPSSASPSPAAFPLSMPQLMGNLFQRADLRQVLQLTAPQITVVPAANPCAVPEPTGSAAWSRWTLKSSLGKSSSSLRITALGECTGLWQKDAALPLPIDTLFQVRLKGQTIAEVPTQADAEKIARQLHQALRQPQFTPQALSPAIVAGIPMGKAGETALFWIAPEWATLLDRNPELMAIDWINQLRVALHVPPLPLPDAQSQMHNLIPTDQQIQGTASWYGPDFHGRLTATGEVFNQHELTAAHPSLPFNTYLKVTNLLTNQTVIVRINDRGPYFADRSLDLSQEAARSLGSELKGVVPYKAVIMQKAELAQMPSTWKAAQAIKPRSSWTKRMLARR